MEKRSKKQKSLVDRLTYAYIRRIKKWMFCPNCQDGKMKIGKKSNVWLCEKCEYKLSAEEFEDDYVFWFCDECNTYLNIQEGFNRHESKHICRNCGYENDTTFDNLVGICTDCGKKIHNPDGTLCIDCKFARKQKAKEGLIAAGKVLGAVAVVGAVAYATSQENDNNDNLSLRLNEAENNEMKCANCGNTDKDTLRDEGDTFYCSKCAHRTLYTTGADDLVECPYCHRMRDRKAMYCRYCNDSTWLASTPEEFKEIDKILKDMGF